MWKQIKNYDYEINSEGIVRRISTQQIKKPYIIHNGYLAVQLNIEGKRKGYLIHRLIAEYFIPNPKNKPFINHIDSNRLNNVLSNLEWCTHQENVIHSYKQGFSSNTGSKNGFSKLNEELVKEIRKRHSLGETNKQIAKNIGVSENCIQQVTKRINWKHVE